jgi:DNA-binding beta-propeller fold protein YncE
MLKTVLISSLAALAIAAGSSQAADSGPASGSADTWASLPDGVRFPEGIAANPATGDIYAGTFDFGPNSNKLVRFARDGHVVAQKDFDGAPLLGLGFANGKVYILNFGASSVQRIDANFTAASPVETVAVLPSIGAPVPRSTGNPDGSSDLITFGSNGKAAPNALVFDHAGNMYVSDSFQGAIFRIAAATTCHTPCPVEMFSHDSQLATAGFPPFGANGLALNAAQSVLYIANTGDNRVVQMDLATKAITPFADSLHGADGLLFDDGVLWVAANQADEMVALDSHGRVVAKVGFFEGIRKDGSPRGLLFPASMVISGQHMYVTNLALPLTPQTGDEPEEDVTRWNIARFHNPLH